MRFLYKIIGRSIKLIRPHSKFLIYNDEADLDSDKAKEIIETKIYLKK